MLTLIHNIRFDRIRKNSDFSFKRNLNNYSNSELETSSESSLVEYGLLSSNWISLYRKQ